MGKFAQLFLKENSEFKYGESMTGDKGERIHTDGGHIDIQHKDTKYSPRKQSIVGFHVDEDKRGKGVGKKLLKHALERHHDLGGQASSHASVKVMHDAGMRNPEIPHGSVEDHVKKLHSDSSVYMAHKDHEGKPYKDK